MCRCAGLVFYCPRSSSVQSIKFSIVEYDTILYYTRRVVEVLGACADAPGYEGLRDAPVMDSFADLVLLHPANLPREVGCCGCVRLGVVVGYCDRVMR